MKMLASFRFAAPRKTARRITAVLALAIAAVGGGTVWAMASGSTRIREPGANGVYHGCYNTGTGQVQLIVSSAHPTCASLGKSWTKAVWNEQGQPGPTGPPGPSGTTPIYSASSNTSTTYGCNYCNSIILSVQVPAGTFAISAVFATQNVYPNYGQTVSSCSLSTSDTENGSNVSPYYTSFALEDVATFQSPSTISVSCTDNSGYESPYNEYTVNTARLIAIEGAADS